MDLSTNFTTLFPQLRKGQAWNDFLKAFGAFFTGTHPHYPSGGIPFELAYVSFKTKRQKYRLTGGDVAILLEFLTFQEDGLFEELLQSKSSKPVMKYFFEIFENSLKKYFQGYLAENKPQDQTFWSEGSMQWAFLRRPSSIDGEGNETFSRAQFKIFDLERTVWSLVVGPRLTGGSRSIRFTDFQPTFFTSGKSNRRNRLKVVFLFFLKYLQNSQCFVQNSQFFVQNCQFFLSNQ